MSTEFLYPVSRQFPFDEVCERIVRELEVRGWNVPDMSVTFYDYGTGEEKYRMVNGIKGKDFCLHFCRIQKRLSHSRNDIAAISEITIPKKQLDVFDDESGPSYYLYVGHNWEKDQNDFFSSIKVNSKLNKKARKYLVYKGVACQGRSQILRNNDDLGREYKLLPTDRKKSEYKTNDVFSDFDQWLRKNVLEYILKQPVTGKLEEKIVEVPVPEGFEWSYTMVSDEDVDRIKSIQSGHEIPKWQIYGLIPEYRFVTLDIGSEGIPPQAYEGSIYCKVGKLERMISRGEVINTDDISKCVFGSYKNIVQINLKNGNDVYIADLSGKEEYLKNIFENNPKQSCLTDEQYRESMAIPGRTLKPIGKYTDGDYKKPIILINRDLAVDEIVLII